MEKKQRTVIGVAMVRLDHIPFVVTNSKRMAVWSDVKEILLWCPSPHCSLVLDTLKLILGYPKYEMMMHPCSQLEQLMFLKHFMFVTHGTLLVDIDILKDSAKLSVLYQKVKEQHTKPCNTTVFNCTKMLKVLTEKYVNTSFKIPLTFASTKMLLPAVHRRRKLLLHEERYTSDRGHLQFNDLCEGTRTEMLEMTEANGQTDLGDIISTMLVPLALLSRLYPSCEGFLGEVVRQYVLGKCGEENLHSVCQCSTEEGIQLTRFLASQNGYDSSWWCLTTCSLLISWSDFWLGIDRVYGGKEDVLSKDVCVVTLNCQVYEDMQDEKSLTYKKTNKKVSQQKTAQCPSPTLSTVTDITNNIQSQNLKQSLAILSAENPDSLIEPANTCECKKIRCYQDIESKLNCVSSDAVDEVKMKQNQECRNSELANGPVSENSLINGDKHDKEEQGEKGNMLRTKTGKTEKKSYNSKSVSRNLKDRTICTENEGSIKSSDVSKSKRIRNHKGKQKKKTDEGILQEKYTDSNDIKSRLRNRDQDKKIAFKCSNANNSASLTTKSVNSVRKKSDSSNSQNSETKTVVTDESFSSGTQSNKTFTNFVTQYTQMQIEMPMSEVSADIIESMDYPHAEGIHISITPKIDMQCDDIPGEMNSEIPLLSKRNTAKKNIDTLQSIRNRREILKINSAQLQDEIPTSLKCAPNNLDIMRSHPNMDQTFTANKNRRKMECKKENQSGVKDLKSSKLEYLSLTPKQLELTGPMLKYSSPSKLQSSKNIPYNQVKANTDETFRKNRTEALIHRPRNDSVSVVLEGKPVYQRTISSSAKHGMPSVQDQQSNFDNQTVGPMLYSVSPNKNGTLHQEIANRLHKKTGVSICSAPVKLMGNSPLAAEGKAVKTYGRETDLNGSDFMTERISMWKDEVNQSFKLSTSSRLIKSADLVRRKKTCTYRPRSSIYSSPIIQDSPSIKTALCALHSRERSLQEMSDKQIQHKKIHVESNNNEFVENIEMCKNLNSANQDSLLWLQRSSNVNQRGRLTDSIIQECHNDVQNFGSSSSLTPDIYDEFARKRKPKLAKYETEKIKPKQATIPIPTTLSQPVTRKLDKPNTSTCKKPNYHTVGFISGIDSNKQQEVDLICKKTYKYTNAIQNKNKPSLIQSEKSTTDEQTDSFSEDSRYFCDKFEESVQREYKERNINEDTCSSASEILDNDIEASVNKVLSCSSIKSDQNIQECSDHCIVSHTVNFNNKEEKFTEDLKASKELNTDKNLLNQPSDRNDVKTNELSSVDKLSLSKDFVASLGRDDNVNKFEVLEKTSSASTVTQNDANNIARSIRKPSRTIGNVHEEIEHFHQASKKYQHLRKSVMTDERTDSEEKTQEKSTMGQSFAKLRAKLYYKVPSDDKFYHVTGNTLIPKDAQFFLSSALYEDDINAERKQCSLDRDERKNHLSGQNEKKQDLIGKVKEIPLENDKDKAQDVSFAEDELSTTTFDSILKASEDFIDKNRLIKHIIDETKKAIQVTQGTKFEDDREKEMIEEGNDIELSYNELAALKNAEKDIYPKVISSYLHSTTESQKMSPKKSFKEIIDEKREEKRRIQEHISKKKYWTSAYSDIGTENSQYVDNRFERKRGQLDKGQSTLQNKQSKSKLGENKSKLQFHSNIDSKLSAVSQQRPQSCIGISKGKVVKKINSNKEIASRKHPVISAKSQTGVLTKTENEKNGVVDSSGNYQTRKSKTLFPRAKQTKNKAQNKTDDCTNKILTALRRLSIETSPKIVGKKGFSKNKTRTSKLRSSVARQASSLKQGSSSSTVETNLNKTDDTTLVNDTINMNSETTDDIKTKEAKSDISNISTIPVVITHRNDTGHYTQVSEVSQTLIDNMKDNIHFVTDIKDLNYQRQNLSLEVAHHEGPGKEFEKPCNSNKAEIIDQAGNGEEIFITLYDTHELDLYTLDSSILDNLSNFNLENGETGEEKYLGIPYLLSSNVNMNNTECRASNGNTFLERDLDCHLSEENDTQITSFINNQLHIENSFPEWKYSQVQIPTVSTVCMQNQNFDTNHCNYLRSDTTVMHCRSSEWILSMDGDNVKKQTNKNDKQDTISNATQTGVNQNGVIDAAETGENVMDYGNLTVVSNGLPSTYEAENNINIGISDKMLNDFSETENKVYVLEDGKTRQETNVHETELYTLENLSNYPFFQPGIHDCILHQSVPQFANSYTCLDAKTKQIDNLEQNLMTTDINNYINEDNKDVHNCRNEAIPEVVSYDVTACDLSSEVFLDETDCGQQVYVGNSHDFDKQNLENGLCIFSGTMKDIKSSPEINHVKNGVNAGVSFAENSMDMQHNLQNEMNARKFAKGKKTKRNDKNKSTKKLIESQSFTSEQDTASFSPSQSEIESHFQEVTKRTGISDVKDNNCDSDSNAKSDDSLPELNENFSIKTETKEDKKNANQTGVLNILATDKDKNKKCSDNLKLTDYTENDGDVDDSGDNDNDDSYSEDDDNDDDYNPNMDEYFPLSDSSDSDTELLQQNADGESCEFKKRKDFNKLSNKVMSKKKSKVSLEDVRSKFQRKYNVINSSAIHQWKQKLRKKNESHDQMLDFKSSKSRKSKEQVNIEVKEFCLKQTKNDDEKMENQMESKTIKISTNIHNSEKSEMLSSSYSDVSSIKSEESVIKNTNKRIDVKQDSSQGKISRKSIKKRKKRIVKDAVLDENSEDDQKAQKVETLAAEGFIKTQKRYYEILRHSNKHPSKTETAVSVEQSDTSPVIEDLSGVFEAVPLHGDRVITKALSDAEKALEGTGSLENIHKEDEGVVIEDIINQCRYQMIEDEDHVQLGGVAFFQDFTLPFIYINGYKYTPLKDALTIFTQDCCVSACTIPRKVLQKQKTLVKSFSTWEQVYKLELIKMKKGPSIKTGDMLVKLNTLLALLPELTQQIVNLHKGTKLKRSQHCDISAYETLKSKFKMNVQ